MTKPHIATDADALMNDGVVRDRVLFFKGETPGDWLIGQIVTFIQRKFENNPTPVDVAVMSPAASFDRVNNRWTFQREAHLVLGASLSVRISPRTDRNKVFAVRFDGVDAAVKEGRDPSRLYTVVEQSQQKLHEALSLANA